MLMLCWYYCIPFVIFLYFALSAVFFVFALFMLRRGTYMQRPKLRQAAFVFMFFALMKTLVFDVRIAAAQKYLLCRFLPEGTPVLTCSPRGGMLLELAGMVLFLAALAGLFQLYRVYMPPRRIAPLTPEDVRLRFWANLTLWALLVMIVWVAAPWVGFLTVGKVPAVFLALPWHWPPLVSFALLLYGFWRAEACRWVVDSKDKSKTRHLNNTWTPRDTLWLCAFLYLIALGLSYVSHDVLQVK